MERYKIKTRTFLLRVKADHEQQRYASWAGLCLYVALDCLLHLVLYGCIVWARKRLQWIALRVAPTWTGQIKKYSATTHKRILTVLTVVSKTVVMTLAFEVLQRYWVVFEKPPISFKILFFLHALLVNLDLEL